MYRQQWWNYTDISVVELFIISYQYWQRIIITIITINGQKIAWQHKTDKNLW